MGSFQRAFLGYRRPEVDAEIQARDGVAKAADAIESVGLAGR